jgi:hypothetical protein
LRRQGKGLEKEEYLLVQLSSTAKENLSDAVTTAGCKKVTLRRMPRSTLFERQGGNAATAIRLW